MIYGPGARTDVQIGVDPKSPDYQAELRKVSEEFEGVLLAKMFKAMRETVPEGGLFDSGFEKSVYEDMLFTELSGVSAQAKGIGIAEMLYQSFLGGQTPSQPNPE